MGIKLHVIDQSAKLHSVDQGAKLNVPVTVIYESSSGDIYQGDYTVTPKVTKEIILETKTKVMKDDVTISKMPQFEVANEAGGKTLILGDDYYGQ